MSMMRWSNESNGWRTATTPKGTASIPPKQAGERWRVNIYLKGRDRVSGTYSMLADAKRLAVKLLG